MFDHFKDRFEIKAFKIMATNNVNLAKNSIINYCTLILILY